MTTIKVFTKKNCPKCPAAKKTVEFLEKQKISHLEIEAYDVETVDGMAEAAFYGVMSTPTVLVFDHKKGQVAEWRGEAPKVSDLKSKLEN